MVAVVVLLCSAAPQDTVAQEEYDTVVDDPLQPVWDQLDDLPRLVSDAIQNSLRAQFVSLNSKVDTRMNAMENHVSAIATVSGVVHDNVEEAVTKLEGHVDTQIAALETRLKEYIHDKFQQAPAPAAGGSGGNAEPDIGASLTATLQENALTLENIKIHVLKINEKVGEGGGEDTCGTLVDKVSELMGNGQQACSGLDQQVCVCVCVPP